MIPTLHTERLTLRAPCADGFPVYADFRGSDRAILLGGPFTPMQAFDQLCCIIGHYVVMAAGLSPIVKQMNHLVLLAYFTQKGGQNPKSRGHFLKMLKDVGLHTKPHLPRAAMPIINWGGQLRSVLSIKQIHDQYPWRNAWAVRMAQHLSMPPMALCTFGGTPALKGINDRVIQKEQP